MVSAVLMVTTFLFDRTTGIATAAAIAFVIVILWYGIALATKLEERR